MLFCLKFLQINGRILRRNLHFIEKTMLGRNALPAWFFIVLDLFPDTFSACMRCVNFNFVYFWSYPDLFPHTEKRHLSYLSNILQKEKSAEKSALFHPSSLLSWHQYHALNVPRHSRFDVIWKNDRKLSTGEYNQPPNQYGGIRWNYAEIFIMKEDLSFSNRDLVNRDLIWSHWLRKYHYATIFTALFLMLSIAWINAVLVFASNILIKLKGLSNGGFISIFTSSI